MIGTTVSHYSIVGLLGKGGMGEVWKAQDTRLDRFVAIKFVPESVAQDPGMVERFLREARAASALNHPHICTIHDIGEWQGRRFIVMELIEGTTLAQAVAEHPLDVETIVDVGIQLADALDAAHAKNIIHRDIKATNILLTPRGQAKILDFGLAKITAASAAPPGEDDRTIDMARDLTDAGHAVGTVGYMSPEQALGKEVDGRTDVFSLGVVLYELATGRRPFAGSTSAAVFDAILNKAPVAPVTLNPNLPAEMERIINKALEKDRSLRYQSAADLTTDLKRLRRDSGSQVAMSAARVPVARRVPWLPITIAAAVVTVAAAVFVIVSRRPAGPSGPVTTRPLTSLVGMEGSGSWSPDGGFFAYGYSDAGPEDIFVVAAEGGNPIKLVESPADDGFPRWSPDNRWIAFSSGRGGGAGIYLVPPLGGAVQKFVDLESTSLYSGSGMGSNPWSPDARTFLFDRPDSSGPRVIWRKDLESRTETPITRPGEGETDSDAAWSFDGRSIAFVRRSETGSAVMVMAPDGSGVRTVLADDHVNDHPAWSPDGRRLVFVSDRSGNRDLWAVGLDGRGLRQVTSGTLDEEEPIVSRTGRVMYNTFDHQTDLYVRDLESGDDRRLTSHTHDNFGGRFSPDGRHMVYSSSRTGRSELWVIDLADGSERQLTNGPRESWYPDWSPDGGSIVFVSDRDGAPRVWRMSADGDAPRRLSERVAEGVVRWSPDGGTIGFVSAPGAPSPFSRGDENAMVAVVPANGGETRNVLEGVVEFEWYRDADHVIATFSRGSNRGQLCAVALKTGARAVLFRDPLLEPVVAADGRAVSYCSATSHFNMNLHVLKLTSPGPDGLPRPAGPPEEVTHGNGKWHVHNGGWSPDGRQVVYTRDTDSGDLFVLDGVFDAPDR